MEIINFAISDRSEKKEVTDLSFFFNKSEWNRVGWGSLPPERDISNPENKEVVGRLRAEQAQKLNH